MITVALIEDNAVDREFIAALLKTSGRYVLQASYQSAEDAVKALARHPTEIALVDIELSGESGTQAVARLHERCPHLRCVMLTNYDDSERLFASLAAGAAGYLLKSDTPREILAGLDELMAGGAPMSRTIARRVLKSFRERRERSAADLTGRETEIMEQLARSHTYKEIARKLGISTATVKNHLYRIYEKLGVRSRTEAVVRWLKR
jgi:DNA-binding NarL/FixJ family response regulator